MKPIFLRKMMENQEFDACPRTRTQNQNHMISV